MPLAILLLAQALVVSPALSEGLQEDLWSKELPFRQAFPISRVVGEHLVIQSGDQVMFWSPDTGREISRVDVAGLADQNGLSYLPRGLRAVIKVGDRVLLTIGHVGPLPGGKSLALLVDPRRGRIEAYHPLDGQATNKLVQLGKLFLICTHRVQGDSLRPAGRLYAVDTKGKLIDLSVEEAAALLPSKETKSLVSFGPEAYSLSEGIFWSIGFGPPFFGQPAATWTFGEEVLAHYAFVEDFDWSGSLKGFTATSAWRWRGTKAPEPLHLRWMFSGDGKLGSLSRIFPRSRDSIWAQQDQDIVRFNLDGEVLKRYPKAGLLALDRSHALVSSRGSIALMDDSGGMSPVTALRGRIVYAHLTDRAVVLMEQISKDRVVVRACRRPEMK